MPFQYNSYTKRLTPKKKTPNTQGNVPRLASVHKYECLKICIPLQNKYTPKGHLKMKITHSNVNYFWSIKTSSEVIEKLRLRNFQGFQVPSFDFSALYTSLSHGLIKAKVLSLVNWCFNRESKPYVCTSLKARFLATRNMTRIYRCWSCPELCEAFTFLIENIYVQFDGMVYQQIVGIPIGTNCVHL